MKIECFFQGLKNANQAVEKLKSAGFFNAYSDINDHYITGNLSINNAGTNDAPSLSTLVLGSDSSVNAGPLLAASPMVSGMGGFEEVADINCRVVVETNDNDAETAIQILKSLGGDLKNPNLKIPKGLENISTKKFISKI